MDIEKDSTIEDKPSISAATSAVSQVESVPEAEALAGLIDHLSSLWMQHLRRIRARARAGQPSMIVACAGYNSLGEPGSKRRMAKFEEGLEHTGVFHGIANYFSH